MYCNLLNGLMHAHTLKDTSVIAANKYSMIRLISPWNDNSQSYKFIQKTIHNCTLLVTTVYV